MRLQRTILESMERITDTLTEGVKLRRKRWRTISQDRLDSAVGTNIPQISVA